MKNLGSIIKRSTAVLFSGITLMTPMYAMKPTRNDTVSYNWVAPEDFQSHSYFVLILRAELNNLLTQHPNASLTDMLENAKVIVNLNFGHYYLRFGKYPCLPQPTSKSLEKFGFDLHRYIRNYNYDNSMKSFCDLYALLMEYFRLVGQRSMKITDLDLDSKNYELTADSFERFKADILGHLKKIQLAIL